MSAQSVPRSDWPAFAEAFARQHHNWLVRLEVERAGTAPPEPQETPQVEVLADRQPLRKFEMERSPEGETFRIAVGEREAEVVHCVAQPADVVFDEATDGAHRGLSIRSESGEVLQVRFRSAARPEELDGIE